MRLPRVATFGGLAYLALQLLRGSVRRINAAFAEGQGEAGGAIQIRDAGPFAMRDSPNGVWSATDEKSDQSFPASDPPGDY